MTAQSVGKMIYATGDLENGAPAHVGYLEDDTRSKRRAWEFEPDAL